MNFSVGSFLAYWINYACTKNAAKLGEWSWRTVVIFQLLAPILIIIGTFFAPESPRWLVKNDRVEAAVKALASVRDDPERVQHEISDISRALQFEKDEISSGYSALWEDKSIRKRLCKHSALIAIQATDNFQCYVFYSMSASSSLVRVRLTITPRKYINRCSLITIPYSSLMRSMELSVSSLHSTQHGQLIGSVVVFYS